MLKDKIREYGADFLLFLVALAWGSTFFIVQEAVDSTPVFVFLFWRFLFASLLMAIFSYKRVKEINLQTIKAGFVLGLFMFLGFAFQTFGLTMTLSSTVAFLTGLNVIIVPFLLYIIFKTKASIYSIFGALVAAVGLYFLTYGGSLGFGLGEFYAFICAVMFALHIVFTDRYSKRYDVMMLVVIQLFVVAVFSLLSSLAFDGNFIPSYIDSTLIYALIVTVLFATVFAFGVQTAMQRYTTPAKTAIIFTMEPVSAGVFGYFFANEILSVPQLFGAFLILFGMVSAELGTYFRDKRRREYIC
ncbi:Permease of the drug/metabolite transporter (DMT) superfamily [hydrothermal vent metagenome]|uniref:Permease of the drug/metabolite transporter (DMT) superfamily n=1 Tax=hydrothermal vent metagenome TaxID=652676 RepID=A0A1W1C0Z6_9ZZZZ